MPATAQLKVLDVKFEDRQLESVKNGTKNIADILDEHAQKYCGQRLPPKLYSDLKNRFNAELAEALRRGAVRLIQFEVNLATGNYLRVKCFCTGEGGVRFFEVPLQTDKPRFEFGEYGPRETYYIVPK